MLVHWQKGAQPATSYGRGGQTFCVEGHIKKNVAAEGRTLLLQSRNIYSMCK